MLSSQLRVEREDFARALYPPSCRLCGSPADGDWCALHALELTETRARCGLCSLPLAAGIGGPGAWPAPPWEAAEVGRRRTSWRRCRACRTQAPGFGRLLALGDYPGELRPWVLALKSSPRPGLVELLAGLLAARMAAAGWVGDPSTPLALVPVPSHELRRLERGFEPVEHLARALAPRVGGRLVRALARRRQTPRQGEPGSGSRSANVVGAFGLSRPRWRGLGRLGPRVVLVDDVCGSGATLSECARELRRAGVERVGALVLGLGSRARRQVAGAP
ncbi:MAG: phosphoribosyltransferase family protein [Planctomycetota bacterium]|nr:phosphoribosyltransferase family protein [Planctomycetota bacterium]